MVEFFKKIENCTIKIARVNSILITKSINLQFFTLILPSAWVRCDWRRFSVLSPFMFMVRRTSLHCYLICRLLSSTCPSAKTHCFVLCARVFGCSAASSKQRAVLTTGTGSYGPCSLFCLLGYSFLFLTVLCTLGWLAWFRSPWSIIPQVLCKLQRQTARGWPSLYLLLPRATATCYCHVYYCHVLLPRAITATCYYCHVLLLPRAITATY